MVERSGNQRHRKSSTPPAERRSRMKTRPDEVYADGGVVKEYIYGQPDEVLIFYDEHTHLTIINFSALEWQLGGTVNRITQTKWGHTKLVCELLKVAPDPNDDRYKYEIHPPHSNLPKGIYPVIKANDLTDLDLAIGLIIFGDDKALQRRTKHTGISLDANAKRFFAETATDARAHRHPHNC